MTMTIPTDKHDSAWLVSLIAELLGINEDQIRTDRPVGELGIDSLTAAQLSELVEERVGTNIPLQRFLGDETLAQLVAASEPAKPGASGAGG